MSRSIIRQTTTLAVAALTAALWLTPASAGAARQPSGIVPGTSSLNGIACASAFRCVAVGSDLSGNGRSVVVSTATGAGKAWGGSLPNHPLSSIACATSTTCVTVVSNVTASVAVANGATKLVRTLTAPVGQIIALDSIACPSTSACYAVGFEGTLSTSRALIAHLSATGGLLGTTTISTSSGIGAIACPTTTRCLLAAANRANPEKIQLLVNGHLGTAHVLPPKTYVQAMACYKALACFALAGKTGSQRTNEIISLSPTTGSIGKVAGIGGTFSGTGLACVNASQCIVIGFTGPSKPSIVVVTRGKPGTLTPVAGTGLGGIACTGASACFAVGQNKTSGIIERV